MVTEIVKNRDQKVAYFINVLLSFDDAEAFPEIVRACRLADGMSPGKASGDVHTAQPQTGQYSVYVFLENYLLCMPASSTAYNLPENNFYSGRCLLSLPLVHLFLLTYSK